MQRGQDYNKEFIMLNTVSIRLDNTLISFLDKYSQELKVSKSWIVRQALQNYFDKLDENLSDMRIETLSKGKSHKEVLREYGL